MQSQNCSEEVYAAKQIIDEKLYFLMLMMIIKHTKFFHK